ncbi:MAG TPA: tellurium resistance protein TerC [Burkholderiaceae bacterium]|jgi:hypothetical protein
MTGNSPPVHLYVAGGLLAALVLSFVAVFLLPGLVHWLRLRRLNRAINGFELRTPPGEFRKLFAGDARLAHLWKEYQDSLHVQREERDGQMLPVAVRATLPAETFFNTQYVVDARLRTEFFKHLPGIFTGIGIIGTFTGLIEGLRQFQVSADAATVRASLESLMHSVGQAFLISASAIAAAMVVTFLEKLLLAALYGRTEDIAHAIDARFEAGAGEDYMSRLVKASEDAGAQSKSLKDALVAELGAVMREQTDRQIAGLAGAISQAVAGEVAKAVGSAMSASLEKGFGGQVANLGELNRQTGEAMQGSVQAMHALIEKMAQTGQQTVTQVIEHAAESQRRRETALVEHSSGAIDSLSELLAKAVSEMSGASTQMARSVDALTHTTTSALARMNDGATQLNTASQRFASAGDRVSGVMEQAAVVSTQLVAASGTMVESGDAMRSGLDDYRAHREAVGQLVTELRATVELARKEATLTADVLGRIEQSSARLGEAQQHADLYLNSVSKVLGDAHQAFATAVKKTLELANTEFHTKLSTAVGLLSSTVVELEATLGNATPQRH